MRGVRNRFTAPANVVLLVLGDLTLKNEYPDVIFSRLLSSREGERCAGT